MTVRVWDLPTRVFHGLLAAAAMALVITGHAGGDAMNWHARLGYAVGALILFRIAWGFVGGHWSRFASFPPSPAAAWHYLREPRAASWTAGHNPLGAFSVYAMLLFFGLQVASGLFSETKEDFAGPLSAQVSHAAAHWLTGYHKNVGQWVLVTLVALHVAAVSYYFFRGRDLLRPMLRGDAPAAAGTPASRDDMAARLMALVLLAASGALMAWVVSLGS